MSYVHARHYYLKNKSGYKVSIFNSKTKTLRSTDFLFSNSELEKIYLKTEKIIKAKIKNSKLMEDFWKHSTDEMKKALCLSYAEHRIKKNRKVANVEVLFDWTNEGYFSSEYKKLLNKNFFKRLFEFRTKGRHNRGIRFDHIHLVEDLVGSKHIYSLHWDNHSPKLLNFSAIYHFVLDDILS
jgi:hypothetical protein